MAARPSGGGEILSHSEIQQLLLRNNAQPELGQPVYIGWSDNRIRPISQSELDAANRAANLGPELTHQTWLKKMGSKRWRFNQGKGTRIATRPVRIRQGDGYVWTEVELNQRVR